MRKRSIVPDHRTESRDDKWLDLAALAEVEVTSESDSNPIEFALLQNAADGWRAAGPGEQTIRIVFDEPQIVTRILLLFEEHELARSHQFVLRWSPDLRESFRDIVRQWSFSPPGTVREREDYQVQLAKAKALELVIVPDIGGKSAIASLKQMRIA
jgi:hypothetical protein